LTVHSDFTFALEKLAPASKRLRKISSADARKTTEQHYVAI